MTHTSQIIPKGGLNSADQGLVIVMITSRLANSNSPLPMLKIIIVKIIIVMITSRLANSNSPLPMLKMIIVKIIIVMITSRLANSNSPLPMLKRLPPEASANALDAFAGLVVMIYNRKYSCHNFDDALKPLILCLFRIACTLWFTGNSLFCILTKTQRPKKLCPNIIQMNIWLSDDISYMTKMAKNKMPFCYFPPKQLLNLIVQTIIFINIQQLVLIVRRGLWNGPDPLVLCKNDITTVEEWKLKLLFLKTLNAFLHPLNIRGEYKSHV